MRVVIQRVSQASVMINGTTKSKIGKGLLILLGIVANDDINDIEWLCHKISHLRIFNDEQQVMNCSVKQINGGIIVVSQFTLYASTKKGNRPSYTLAAKPDVAIPLYERFVKTLELTAERSIGTGFFGADMQVSLINDGPVTIIIDSKLRD